MWVDWEKAFEPLKVSGDSVEDRTPVRPGFARIGIHDVALYPVLYLIFNICTRLVLKATDHMTP